MRKLLFALAALAVAVLASAFVAPWLIDANAYRTEIARRVSSVTGREVAIDGTVEFVLLPSPRVRASDVRVVDAESDLPATINARHIELELGWGSLLGRAVDITRLRVIEPQVVIDASRPKNGGGVPQLGPIAAVRIERTDIQNGRIVWMDPQAKAPRTVEQIQGSIIASPLASSIRITGTAVASAVPVEFDAVIGDAPAGRPNPVSVTATIRPSLARASLRGAYDVEAKSLRGRLQIEGGDLFAALDVTGVTVDGTLAGPASQPFSATGDLIWTNAGIAANDIVLQLGEVRATGGINATLGRTPAVDVALALTWLDADKLARLERPAAAAPRAGPRRTDAAIARLDAHDGERQRLSDRPLDLTLDLGIEAVGLHGGVVRQLRLNAVMSRGDLVINQASALLPGGTELSGFAQIAFGVEPARIDGTVIARSDNLRGLIDWLGMDTSGVPAGRLRRFEGQARLQGTPGRVELTGINLAFDSTRAIGGVAIATGPRLGLGLDVKIDQINIDGYSTPDSAASAGRPGNALSAALLDRFDANLRLAAETVTVGGEPLSGVMLDATLQRGDVALRRLDIGDVAGARIEAHGRIAALAREAASDLQVVLHADDASRLLRLADLAAAAPASLSLNGRLRLQADGDAVMEDLELTYGGARAVGKATLTHKPARRLALDLKAARLSLESLPRVVPEDSATTGIDLVVSADAIAIGAHEVGTPRLEAHFDGGAPTAIDLAGTLYDGALDLTVRSEGADRRKLNGAATLRNADLGRALSALIEVDAIKGRGDFRMAFSAPARWGADIWSGLSGALELKGRDGVIEGLDLPLMRDMLHPGDPPADIVTLLGAGLHGGATPFSALDAAAHIQAGALSIDTLRIATAAGEATGGGGVDLGRSTLDIWLALPIAGGDVPPVRLQVTGRFDEPRIALDFAQLQSYLARRQAERAGQHGGASQ